MNGFYGLGPKPIRVNVAIPKRSLAEATNKISTTYSDMYESYMDQNAWSNFGKFQGTFKHSVEITEFYSHNNFLQEFCEIIFVIRRIKLEILITFVKCESEIIYFSTL